MTKASLTVVEASSVYNNDETKWGSDLALTDPSLTFEGYWHSGSEDKNPWIIFKMANSNKVASIEVLDRLDNWGERFEEVEVRVGVTDSFEEAISCGIQSYTNSSNYTYECPDNTVGQYVIIKKLGTTVDFLHVNHVSVMVCCEEESEIEPTLTVLAWSSVYANDSEKWGPELALTEPSSTYTGYWHSDTGDKNPWIFFEMSEPNEVLSVEVTDRLDDWEKRFEEVEVRVGANSFYQDAVSCGIQSYRDSTTYNYQCPENTIGKKIFIKKLGTTVDFLHINHIKVKAKGKSCP